MSAFVLAALPGSRVISVPHLSIAQKTAEIEDLASATGLTRHMTTVILQTLAHDSLAGEALMLAWLKVEQAIACRDATRVLDEKGREADPELQDPDYEGYRQDAADAICDLIHGINISTARGSGITPRGTSA
jgi:hypothetical protein